jgi:uncharacterized protein YjiS (DUF1127 family)
MNLERTLNHTGTWTAPTDLSHDEINRYRVKARQLRAEANAATMIAAGRAVMRALRSLRARLALWQGRRRTYEALTHCSDRVLADIGIEREHIPLIAKGIDPSRHVGRVHLPGRWWSSARARLEAARAARQERRRIWRELMAYQDRELDELGVRRADIPAIARAEPVLRKAA